MKYIIKKIIFDIYNTSHFHENIKRYAKKILSSNQFNLEKKAKWRKLNLILRMKEKKKKKIRSTTFLLKERQSSLPLLLAQGRRPEYTGNSGTLVKPNILVQP